MCILVGGAESNVDDNVKAPMSGSCRLLGGSLTSNPAHIYINVKSVVSAVVFRPIQTSYSGTRI